MGGLGLGKVKPLSLVPPGEKFKTLITERVGYRITEMPKAGSPGLLIHLGRSANMKFRYDEDTTKFVREDFPVYHPFQKGD